MKRIKTLKMNYEFKNVFEKGKYYVNDQVIVYVLKNKLEYNRIGIAVSTKLGHAVKRNRIKRLIRSAYQSFDLKNESLDIVFTWNKKSSIEDASYEIIREELSKTFKRIQILNED
jgi:ribonuclease P protein component